MQGRFSCAIFMDTTYCLGAGASVLGLSPGAQSFFFLLQQEPANDVAAKAVNTAATVKSLTNFIERNLPFFKR